MNSWTYHSVIPENNKSSFTEYDNIDFVATFEGRAMNLNSLRITGDLTVTNDNQPLSATANVAKDIKLDRQVGAHAIIESITTSFFNGGNSNIIENLTEYPRYVKMKNAARKGPNQMNNASNVCQLLAPYERMTNLILKGTTPAVNAQSVPALSPDFSIKPEICLNNASGSPHLPYSKSGAIRLTLNLGRVFSVLYGLDVSSTTKYSVENLKVSFSSVPETPDMMSESVVMRTVLNLKQSIESSFANIGVKVPAVCDRMSASFQLQNQENTAQNNNTDLTKVRGLTELQFLFNDSTNSIVSYLLRDYEEVISKYIESFYDTGKNSMSTTTLANNDGFGCGLNFDDFIDLRNQKFNLQLSHSLDSSDDNLLIYMYFHSIMRV